MHEIHELLDPVNSIHSVGKSFDHTLDLVRQAVSKVHCIVTQGDLKTKEVVESHAIQMRDLNNLNLAQTDRIKALSMAMDGQGGGCEESQALLEEMTLVRQENEELQFRVNELACQLT